MHSDEQQLQEAFGNGDRDAFAALYDAYLPKIHAYLFYRVGHRETAEDLASDVFLKAAAHARSFSPDKGSFSSWIYRIARNVLVDHVRSRRGEIDIADLLDTLASPENVAQNAELKERAEQAQKAMLTLSPQQRDLIVMRVWDGLTYKEIAAITGKTEAACKVGFARAVKVLKDAIPLLILFLIRPTV